MGRECSGIMRRTVRGLAGIAVVALSGCAAFTPLGSPERQVVSGAPVPPAVYAGQVAFRIMQKIASPRGELPITLYAGFREETPTRIAMNAAADLRQIQRELPVLLAGRKKVSCGIDLTVRLDRTEAIGTDVRAVGIVRGDLYRCKGRDTDNEVRGVHLLSQNVRFDVAMGSRFDGRCMTFELHQADVEPTGFIGWVVNVFGATEAIQKAILKHGNEALEKKPVCPKLPEELVVLEPRFFGAGPFEIGDGGIGAALSGSVSIGSERLIALLSLLQAKGHLPKPPGPEFVRPVPEADGVAFGIEKSMDLRNAPVRYRLALDLEALAPTRIGMAAVLDLRDLQQHLATLAEGLVLIDTCVARIELLSAGVEVSGKDVVASVDVNARGSICKRGDSGDPEAVNEAEIDQLSIRAGASVNLADNCLTVQLAQLRSEEPLPLLEDRTKAAKIAALRFQAVGLLNALLAARPLCPELPKELRALAPQFTQGTFQEIGDGGLGVDVAGSVNLSAEAVLALLAVLQEKGVLPPAP